MRMLERVAFPTARAAFHGASMPPGGAAAITSR
jgi:hypothetical protein